MTPTTPLRVALVALAVLLACAACQVLPPPAQTTTAPWTYETDGIGWQYAASGGTGVGAVLNSTMGAAIDTCPYAGCTPPAADLAARTAAGTLPRVLIELGINEPANGGWTTTDEQHWTAALTALAPGTCTVLVLPYTERPDIVPAVAQARTWLAWAAATLGMHTIDWAHYATRPGVLAPDGIHLTSASGSDLAIPATAEALDAWSAMAADAATLCP